MLGYEAILAILPFVVVAWIARRIFRETGDARAAAIVFIAATIVLVINAAWGYHTFEKIAAQKKWTAASFALARTLLQGGIVGAGTWLTGEWVIVNRRRRS